jgi:hypothetical protein
MKNMKWIYSAFCWCAICDEYGTLSAWQLTTATSGHFRCSCCTKTAQRLPCSRTRPPQWHVVFITCTVWHVSAGRWIVVDRNCPECNVCVCVWASLLEHARTHVTNRRRQSQEQTDLTLTNRADHSHYWKATGHLAVRETPHILWNPKFITVFTTARLLSVYWVRLIKSTSLHITYIISSQYITT